MRNKEIYFDWFLLLEWSLLMENIIAYVWWPTSVSLSGYELPLWMLISIFLFCNLIIWYAFWKSYLWNIMKGVFENSKTIRSLWVNVNKSLYRLFWLLFIFLAITALLVIVDGNVRPSDGLFYLIKWLGIMILVWIAKKEYVFLWALMYVLLEYMMFIKLELPIAYKETLILIIILLVLIFKPEWLFNFQNRRM